MGWKTVAGLAALTASLYACESRMRITDARAVPSHYGAAADVVARTSVRAECLLAHDYRTQRQRFLDTGRQRTHRTPVPLSWGYQVHSAPHPTYDFAPWIICSGRAHSNWDDLQVFFRIEFPHYKSIEQPGAAKMSLFSDEEEMVSSRPPENIEQEQKP
jgi:hypothetical protein